jgi:phage host-nuclease inhibitor protein Gam
MAETLNAHQLIQLAQCLTRMQSAITDYELRHFNELTSSQKNRLEETLTQLAAAAGRIYAYSVQLIFREAETKLQQLKKATEGLKKFLQTTQKIQQVLDIVSNIASLADAIISHDVEGITLGIDQIIQMVGNN